MVASDKNSRQVFFISLIRGLGFRKDFQLIADQLKFYQLKIDVDQKKRNFAVGNSTRPIGCRL